MTKIADILRYGKLLIETHGWGQGNGVYPPRGCYCVLTAIAGDKCNYHYDTIRLFKRANDLDAESAPAIYVWNDAPGRTKEEVLAAFDKAIALAEQENA